MLCIKMNVVIAESLVGKLCLRTRQRHCAVDATYIPSLLSMKNDLNNLIMKIDGFPGCVQDLQQYFYAQRQFNNLPLPNYDSDFKYIKDKENAVLSFIEECFDQLLALQQQQQQVIDVFFNEEIDASI